jgi:hypothetical protein
MTEQEARERPLNEVWEAMKDATERAERTERHLRDNPPKDDRVGRNVAGNMRADLKMRRYDAQMFRAILLERAQREWGMVIVDGCISLTPVNNMTADECSALVGAMSFMAWELEQRGREVGNG